MKKHLCKAVELGNPGPWFARLPAYYASITGDQSYAERAWNEFFNAGEKRYHTDFDIVKFDSIQSLQPVYEVKGVSTNNTAQWCLNAIELLQLVGNEIPNDNPRVQDAK